MNLTKSLDHFNPTSVERCHIIGCGSVGSTVAELLVRLGLTKISLYDFDVVNAHNLANQMFNNDDIKKEKVYALRDMLIRINPEVAPDIETHGKGYTSLSRLNGYVFLCVDNIDLRREIVTKNKFNHSIKAMFDFRTTLETMQLYAADWSNPKMIEELLKSMNFSHEEATASTPKTACGVELGVAPTVRVGSSLGVSNFVNFINKQQLRKLILVDAFNFEIESY